MKMPGEVWADVTKDRLLPIDNVADPCMLDDVFSLGEEVVTCPVDMHKPY